LISAGLVDELFLTLAPKLLGSDTAQESRTILSGVLPATVDLRLLSAHLVADELFLRYTVSSDQADDAGP
jgi:5-amino-6-(5-phosphoribosylamino)uracil reductase